METIYLDYNSTTPVDPEVLESMLPWFTGRFGNPASSQHKFGWEAAAAVEKAREEVASLIGAGPEEIIFTSGATESLNLAIRGAFSAYSGKGRHLVVGACEHKAVLDTAEDLRLQGAEISCIGVDREGRIDLQELSALLREDTVMVAVMMANNETGVIQNSAAIGSLCRERRILHLSDTTQAAGKIRVDVNEHNLDLCSISSHKLYGPKGVGALYVRRRSPRVRLHAQLTGGGHERGMRSGTLNVPGIVGMGTASRLAGERLWSYGAHTSRLRTLLEQQVTTGRNAIINGSIRHRLPNTTNICFREVSSARLIGALPDLAFSTGSACTSALQQPSHVLSAMGISAAEAGSSVRFSLGMDNTGEEISRAVLRICDTLDKG